MIGVLPYRGFSTVHLVQDKINYRLYALKIMACHDPEDEKAALQEAEYYQALSHPNLVTCTDYDLASRVPGSTLSRLPCSEVRILLPYFRRGTLQDELMMRQKRGDHIPESRVLRLFHGMCEGVRVLHTHRPHPLAHRDLKPANLLLSDDDTPVWMDFGSMGRARVEVKTSAQARALQDLAAEKCSMPYRAPELFSVESHTSLDERVDIWSLGCCLYALCYFQSPFDAAHIRGDSVALAVLSEAVVLPDNSPLKDNNFFRSIIEVLGAQSIETTNCT
ncbi:STK16 [Cordylochernes scorpioides]|uniref:non-specific serine/threonine protein kinase n=1 Tax=Cordylochernes scorpioides TaxID=51811 RepID=A0ABY6K347_9ARAC|nr:STK16 [Cordylochernes scorpioides]